MMIDKEQRIFTEKLEFALDHNKLVKLVLSNKKNKSSELNKITVSPTKIKNELKFSFTYTFNTKDEKKNFDISGAIKEITAYTENDFRNFDLFTTDENIHYIINKKATKAILKISEPTFKVLPDLDHDRRKKQRISTSNNIYLEALGITNNKGKINKNMHDKFRQINKYLEIFESLLNNLRSKHQIKIADMGSGKGYLTFALYDFLNSSLKLDTVITGIEFRKELVDKCELIAEKCNFKNLNFKEGSIAEYNDKADVLIALHACDTATDDAIFKGIRSKAELIIVAPCCQKQIRKEFNVNNDLASVLKFGILKERQAELITDGIRALILEAYGYKTKVFEFISTEHTAKNIMITAELTSKKINKEQIFEKINAIKNIFGIKQHYLEKLLNFN